MLFLYITYSIAVFLTLSAKVNAAQNASDALPLSMAATLVSRSILLGENSFSYVRNGVWWGNDGPFTVDYINKSGQELALIIWGSSGLDSYVNVVKPLMTVAIPVDSSKTISFDYGAVGAWSTVYPDTPTDSTTGQIPNTWGEFSFGAVSMYDVSGQVNMTGHHMSIVGPTCRADMDTCVFVCSVGQTCSFGYELRNCTTGSQEGAASYGTSSGGCKGPGSSGGALTTTFY